MPITYADAGVDYKKGDPFKKLAQILAVQTAHHLKRFGVEELAESRGESAYLIEERDRYLALVIEGLGTKNKVAEAMHKLTGKLYFANVAQDTVAMIVNDMITLGALPMAISMHLAVGASDWFKDEARACDLVEGWMKACDLARCAWGPGETPTLKGIVFPDTIELSGAAVGQVKPKSRRIKGDIKPGDRIVIFESAGIHANGISTPRKLVDDGLIPDGWLAKLSDGRTFGESVLDPTIIYVPLMEAMLAAGIEIHYAVNVTGHGWRKFMRYPMTNAYVFDRIPEPQPVFGMIQKVAELSDKGMYETFNMGAGFAVFVPESEVPKIAEQIAALKKPHPFRMLDAGHIEPASRKRVQIRRRRVEDIVFDESELDIR